MSPETPIFGPCSGVLVSKVTPGPLSHDWSILTGSLVKGENQGRVIVGLGTTAVKGGSDTLVATPQPCNDGRWHHLLWTRHYSGSNTLYIDGEPVTNAADGGDWINSPVDIMIGGDPRPADGAGAALPRAFFRERMDEVAIYGQALGAERVRGLFQAGREKK
jgi:hypothetical protein